MKWADVMMQNTLSQLRNKGHAIDPKSYYTQSPWHERLHPIHYCAVFQQDLFIL